MQAIVGTVDLYQFAYDNNRSALNALVYKYDYITLGGYFCSILLSTMRSLVHFLFPLMDVNYQEIPSVAFHNTKIKSLRIGCKNYQKNVETPQILDTMSTLLVLSCMEG